MILLCKALINLLKIKSPIYKFLQDKQKLSNLRIKKIKILSQVK